MSMKTIKEWIELCADDTIREKWLINHLNYPHRYSGADAEDMAEALILWWNFSWIKSPEGYDYWRGIHDDMVDNPEKYLKKKKVMFHEYENN